ncbi:hypothetical protein [Embleya sp. NPDC059237]|uniref:hypothetical protein n=1 Tax=Embleya sp. NPDC059237 TaxID=3346784 RepID=UPI0036B44029
MAGEAGVLVVLRLGDTDRFTSYRALRVFRRLGFVTSEMPQPSADDAAPPEQASGQSRLTDEYALRAFRRLTRFRRPRT